MITISVGVHSGVGITQRYIYLLTWLRLQGINFSKGFPLASQKGGLVVYEGSNGKKWGMKQKIF